VDRDQSSNLPAAAGDAVVGDAAGDRAMADPAAGDAPAGAAARPSRRQLLYGAGAGLGLAALAPVPRPASHLGGAVRGGGARVAARAAADRCLDFGHDWKFVLVNPNGTSDPTGACTNAYQPGFDDSSFRTTTTRHRRPTCAR